MTTGVDSVTGGTGNDTVVAILGTGATMTALDSIDTGAGTDSMTLNVIGDYVDAGLAAGVTVSNLETMNVRASGVLGDSTGDFDVSTVTGLENLNITLASDVYTKASATTDVAVSGSTGVVDVDGGKDVTVTVDANTGNVALDDAAGTINISGSDFEGSNIATTDGTDVTIDVTAKAATGTTAVGTAGNEQSGAVSITQNLESTGDALDNSGGTISVTGGTTVDVTINGTITADAAGDDGNALTAGATTVTSDGNTTDVTITQNLTATDYSKAATADVKASQVLTFKALANGETTTVGGLTFTASKALTASEVAEAFAGLTATDTQDAGGPTANGYYTGSLVANWTSGAANGAEVTFTGAAHNTGVMTVTAGVVDPTSVYTAGTDNSGTAESADVSVNLANVKVVEDAAASVKNITLTNFVDADLNDASFDALETLTLKGSAGDVLLQTAQTSLTVNVDGITGTLDLDDTVAGPTANVETLTLNTSGTASSFDLTATAVKTATINAGSNLTLSTTPSMTAAESITITGAGTVTLGDISTYVALNTFDASANTGGVSATVETVDATITGTLSEYVFSAGNDTVTFDQTTIDTKVSLGAGDDKLTLATGTAASNAVLDGGTGTNTIAMAAADAETLSATATFEAKMDNFSKLSVGEVATTADNTVNLANMDDISYVITNGSADTAEVTVLTTVSTAAEAVTTGTLSVVVGGTTYSVAANTDANQTLVDLATAIQNDSRVATAAVSGDVDNATITVTSNTGYALEVGTLTSTLDTGTALTATNSVTSSELFLTNMADAGTVELTAAGMGATVTMADATGSADSLNVVTKDLTAVNVGTVSVAGVETINVSTTDTFTDANSDGVDDTNSSATMYVTGDKLATLNVSGAGDLTLTSNASTLTSVDASSMTGTLTYTATVNSLSITGGSAGDTITVNSDSVQLNAGAGDDTINITAGADLLVVYGGAGADTFNVNGAASTQNSYAVIKDLAAGDIIDFANADSFASTAVTLSEGATESTQAYLTQAMGTLGANDMGWFQYNGNTFIVMDENTNTNGANAFTDGEDVVVMISGLVDLSTASFNATNGTLEIA